MPFLTAVLRRLAAMLGPLFRWGISLPEDNPAPDRGRVGPVHPTNNGWGAKILGRPQVLDQWASSLKPPHDPWVEVHQGEHVLRAQSLDESGSAGEVKDRAVAQIKRLNGAMALFSAGAEPVKSAGVIATGLHIEPCFWSPGKSF
jgi:hypothetical protein